MRCCLLGPSAPMLCPRALQTAECCGTRRGLKLNLYFIFFRVCPFHKESMWGTKRLLHVECVNVDEWVRNAFFIFTKALLGGNGNAMVCYGKILSF